MDTIYTEAHRRLIRALQKARKAAGMTQAEVAEKIGKPQQIVSQLERGNRRLDVVELAQMCNLFSLDLLEFLAPLRLQESLQTGVRPQRDQGRPKRR